MRKPAFCIYENKGADQRLCFRYTDSTIPLLSDSEIASLKPYSVIAQPGLCQTWSETPKIRFSHNEAHIFMGFIKKKPGCAVHPVGTSDGQSV